MTWPLNRSNLAFMSVSAAKRFESPFAGALLIALGLAWLLRTAGVWKVSWPVVLSLLLLMVGIGLMVGGRRWQTRGLMTFGLLLTLVLATNTSGDFVIGSGVGGRVFAPTRGEQLGSHNLAIGTLGIQLDDLILGDGDSPNLQAHVAVGELIVRVPPGIVLEGKAQVGIGGVKIDGVSLVQGVGVETDLPEPPRAVGPAQPVRRIRVDFNVLIGQIRILHRAPRN